MVGARQFDEQEAIAIALDVFWRKGLHDATMQDLATATGVQRGSLYNAYGDKEGIFLRAFDQYAEQFLKRPARHWPSATRQQGSKSFLTRSLQICQAVRLRGVA
jgi:TetR/AcrR family transcriptional regulator, transcriptional repressor for nem operon